MNFEFVIILFLVLIVAAVYSIDLSLDQRVYIAEHLSQNPIVLLSFEDDAAMAFFWQKILKFRLRVELSQGRIE